MSAEETRFSVRNGRNGFESHAQTVIQVIVTALLLWIGSSLIDVRDRLIKLEVLYQTGAVASAAEVTRLRERVDVLERKTTSTR